MPRVNQNAVDLYRIHLEGIKADPPTEERKLPVAMESIRLIRMAKQHELPAMAKILVELFPSKHPTPTKALEVIQRVRRQAHA